jgi:molecular chaperone GrpE
MPEPNVSEISAEDIKPSVENVSSVDLAAQLSSVSSERDQLLAEKAELQDLLQRRQAEFDNFRRRTERERSEFAQYAGMELIRELLPIIDDFDRAMQSDAGSKDYAKGIEMIHNRTAAALKKAGLEPIESQGKMFDPHIHQAVEKVHTNEAEDHMILGEFQKGYNFKGKLLRPAMVKVAVKP